MNTAAEELWLGFLDALEGLGVGVAFDLGDVGGSPWDVRGVIEGVPVAIEVKVAPTSADIERLERRRPRGVYRVVVAGRLSRAMRDSLARSDVGYYDARGHLRLWHRPLLVDTAVASAASDDEPSGAPLRIDSASMLDVALAVLDESAAKGVRSAAEVTGRSPGTVSRNLARLRGAHLADDRNEAMVPDLFEAVVEVWHPHRVSLAALPPSSGASAERLRVNLGQLEETGWVLADARAAAAWGAPVVLAGDSPPDFYVPSQQIVRNAQTLLGPAEFGAHACTVAVAPAPYVCRRRFDRSGEVNEPYSAPSAVVAALDLAADPGRGRETLDLWSRRLPPGVRRVW